MSGGFRGDWENFYSKVNKEIGVLQQSVSELRGGESKAGFLKKVYHSFGDFLESFIGLPFTRNCHAYRCHPYGFIEFGSCRTTRVGVKDNRIYLDNEDRISMIRLGGYCCSDFKSFCCDEKGAYFSTGRGREEIDGFVDNELSGSYYEYVNKGLSNVLKFTKELVDFLPSPFTKRLGDLKSHLESEGVESKRLFSFSERFLELEELVKQKRAYLGRFAGPGEERFDFSVDEVLGLGVVARVDAEKLERPVLALFRKRDQRVPELLDELGEKNQKSFLHLLRVLEAEVAGGFSCVSALPLSEVCSELSYFKSCGVDVEVYKREIAGSVRKKEGERRRVLKDGERKRRSELAGLLERIGNV